MENHRKGKPHEKENPEEVQDEEGRLLVPEDTPLARLNKAAEFESSEGNMTVVRVADIRAVLSYIGACREANDRDDIAKRAWSKLSTPAAHHPV